VIDKVLPEEREFVVVFGSSAIALRGISLGREINDLDLFVSDATFDKISSRLPVHFKDGKNGERVPYLSPSEKIEILKSFPGVTFRDVLAHASKTGTSEGLLVGSIDDIKLWKRAQGREKDMADIEAIERDITAPLSIIIIHWKIRREREVEFREKWKTLYTIKDREGLIGEFLSKLERKSNEYPYITWPIECDDPTNEEKCVHYINVALWSSHKRFYEEVGHNMRDDQPIQQFEIERRRRVAVTPAEWRIGPAKLPTDDSDGTK
jgi:hypothetical protein